MDGHPPAALPDVCESRAGRHKRPATFPCLRPSAAYGHSRGRRGVAPQGCWFAPPSLVLLHIDAQHAAPAPVALRCLVNDDVKMVGLTGSIFYHGVRDG